MTSTSSRFEIPDDMVPEPHELPGDLAEMAIVLDGLVPGKGVAMVLAIVERFRGTYIYCHNVDALYRGVRDRYIRQLRDQEVTVPEIARLVKLGERRVWDILNECEPVGNGQLSLF